MKKKKRYFKYKIIIYILLFNLLFIITIGYSKLYTQIDINSNTNTRLSKSTAEWNITNKWVNNKIYYYQFILNINNKDGSVTDAEREISFEVPNSILINECNIWVAETKKIVENRLYIKCYSWAIQKQRISLTFQLAFNKNITNLEITKLVFKNRFLYSISKNERLR